MMLRNFDYAIKYFDYKSKTEIEDISNPLINGWYKFVNGVFSALLVVDNNLYFLFGKEKFLITEYHRVLLKKHSNVESKFSLIDGNGVQVKFLYSVPNTKLNVSPFEYIDQDDFKWGDFIAKIINDGVRKRNFVSNLMDIAKTGK
ncbi:hypothetical protein ACFE6N_08000 [Pedobacter sp. BG31]|uniref:hypothetical protein n=1 Tax=Pedobacter sp. BG31 TaxID=3349697 RepID=UPI0035F3A628